MPASFDADIKHWPTLDAFVAFLQGVSRPPWCRRITNHNTFIPNETQWRGVASVKSCMKTYIGKGWNAGPQLFLAAEAPNPAHRGIFQLTPIVHQGTHAGDCNPDALGVEHVGDFDARPPSQAQYQLLLDVNRAIMHHWKIPPEQINVHNECMVGRTCPGKHLTGVMIRADLSKPTDPFAAWGPIGKPMESTWGWAIPRAWLMNKALGACVRAEEYLTPALSVAVFARGFIWYNVATKAARVEMF